MAGPATLPEDLLGDSYEMRRVLDLIAKVAPTHATVLITGESGTGKELVARAIHDGSPRCHNAFVSQNCTALNDNLLESELFGHLRGSFTGAVGTRPGLFDVADGGTLFLDEVGDMSPALQVKLLRVIQEGIVVPVGGTQSHRTDVRLVSATHRALEPLVQTGAFREDLYYRLHVFTIEVPPLRERRDDILILARHFLRRSCECNRVAGKSLGLDVSAAFRAYDWPGNVRELENEIARLVILSGDEAGLVADHLSPGIRAAAHEHMGTRGRRLDGRLTDALEELERDMLAEGLRRNHWNKSLTARDLGISRANLVAKVRKYHLEPLARPQDCADLPMAQPGVR